MFGFAVTAPERVGVGFARSTSGLQMGHGPGRCQWGSVSGGAEARFPSGHENVLSHTTAAGLAAVRSQSAASWQVFEGFGLDLGFECLHCRPCLELEYEASADGLLVMADISRFGSSHRVCEEEGISGN